MGNSSRLKTSDQSGMKDVSLLASGGVVTRGAVSGFNSDDTNGEPVKELIVKSAGVKSHQQLMQAHQAGSITKDDAAEVQKPVTFRGNTAKAEGAGMQTITSLASGPQKAVQAPATYKGEQTSGGVAHGQPPSGGAIYEGGRSNPSNTVYRDNK